MKEKNKNISRKKYWLSLFLTAVLSVSVTGGVIFFAQSRDQAARNQSASDATEINKIAATYETILNKYVGEIDKEKLVDGAISGMTSALEDPYSDYFSGQEAQELEENISGSFEGIGATMSMQNELPTVAEPPIKDSPAEKANLKAKDSILKVNGEDIKGQDLTEVVGQIRGKKGTDVTLTIQRAGEIFDVTITRDTIPIESVYGELAEEDKTIGVIQITTFSQKTTEEFETKVKELRKKGAKSLVVDVRRNPGGLLNQVSQISSMFLEDGQTIVKFEDKDKQQIKFTASKQLDGGFKVTEPTVVLVDENSASAAEIFAAALKESGNKKVIGQTTFGKGTVQEVINDIPGLEKSDLKLTVSKWLTPKENWIHEKGLEPTIEVLNPAYYDSLPIDKSITYQKNAKSVMVKNINGILAGLDYAVDKNSDSYTEATVQAVKDFQAKEKLPVTGDIEEETAIALETALYEKILAVDKQMDRAMEEIKK